MIDYHKQLVTALNTVLPTHYEMTLTSKTGTPCISYMEVNNYVTDTGDTLGYSQLSYQVKVWGTNLADLQNYAMQIDNVLRPLYDRESAMIQKIMTFEALGLESYS